MTCKDCVHGVLCTNIGKMFTEIDNVSVAKACRHFKNKADYTEVKHGEWVRQKGQPEAICSECGREVVYRIINNKWGFESYCPCCGAKMDRERSKGE